MPNWISCKITARAATEEAMLQFKEDMERAGEDSFPGKLYNAAASDEMAYELEFIAGWLSDLDAWARNVLLRFPAISLSGLCFDQENLIQYELHTEAAPDGTRHLNGKGKEVTIER